jgi:hypothetical protein
VPDHDDDLITTATACAILGGREAPINPSTLWRWIKAGRISPPLSPALALPDFVEASLSPNAMRLRPKKEKRPIVCGDRACISELA